MVTIGDWHKVGYIARRRVPSKRPDAGLGDHASALIVCGYPAGIELGVSPGRGPVTIADYTRRKRALLIKARRKTLAAIDARLSARDADRVLEHLAGYLWSPAVRHAGRPILDGCDMRSLGTRLRDSAKRHRNHRILRRTVGRARDSPCKDVDWMVTARKPPRGSRSRCSGPLARPASEQ